MTRKRNLVAIQKDGRYKITMKDGQSFLFEPLTFKLSGEITYPLSKELRHITRNIDRAQFLSSSRSRRAPRPEGFMPSIEPFTESFSLPKVMALAEAY